jgi:hypothetical protein
MGHQRGSAPLLLDLLRNVIVKRLWQDLIIDQKNGPQEVFPNSGPRLLVTCSISCFVKITQYTP